MLDRPGKEDNDFDKIVLAGVVIRNNSIFVPIICRDEFHPDRHSANNSVYMPVEMDDETWSSLYGMWKDDVVLKSLLIQLLKQGRLTKTTKEIVKRHVTSLWDVIALSRMETRNYYINGNWNHRSKPTWNKLIAEIAEAIPQTGPVEEAFHRRLLYGDRGWRSLDGFLMYGPQTLWDGMPFEQLSDTLMMMTTIMAESRDNRFLQTFNRSSQYSQDRLYELLKSGAIQWNGLDHTGTRASPVHKEVWNKLLEETQPVLPGKTLIISPSSSRYYSDNRVQEIDMLARQCEDAVVCICTNGGSFLRQVGDRVVDRSHFPNYNQSAEARVIYDLTRPGLDNYDRVIIVGCGYHGECHDDRYYWFYDYTQAIISTCNLSQAFSLHARRGIGQYVKDLEDAKCLLKIQNPSTHITSSRLRTTSSQSEP